MSASKILLKDFTIVTMNERHDLLEHAHLVVEDGKIASLAAGPAPAGDYDEVIDGGGTQVLMPGLVNTHCHAPMTLMRGYGGGHDLQTWLNEYIFPVEDKLTPETIRAGTQLAAAEMIANGVTTFADMYYFCDDMAETVLDAGLNMNLSRGVTIFQEIDDPASFVSCAESLALADQWHGAGDGQITIDMSIHGEYTSFMAPKVWEYLAGIARDRGLGIHVHLSETKSEHEECMARHGGLTPFQILDRHGVWDGTRGMCAHCVWVSEEDMAKMAEKKVSVLHNPTSNLKLGSGIAPVARMRKEYGLNVALGTDGASSNNNLDLFAELKLAALLASGATRDPNALPAWEALELATVNGAKALGRSDTGSLVPGKAADLIALDFDRPHLSPCHAVEEHLVYSARGSDVVLTMARGKILYRNGFFSTIDLDRMKYNLGQALPVLYGE
jgi:5-methylthioadenosine/S-adenosylhomocysteine deaminase